MINKTRKLKIAKIKAKFLKRFRLQRSKFTLTNSWLIYKCKRLFRAAVKPKSSSGKLLIIGGTSDIAKALRRKLSLLRIEYSFTARDRKAEADFLLDYDDPESIVKFINKTDFNAYKTIIFFTGYLNPESDELPCESNTNISSSYISASQKYFDQHTQINALYPYIIARLIGQKLKEQEEVSELNQKLKAKSTNFVFITSNIGTSRQTIFPSLYFYRAGKAALHAMLSALFLELNTTQTPNHKSGKFGIILLGPGSARSRMNPYGSITADESAKFIAPIIMDTSTSGLFLFMDHLKQRLYL